MPLNVVKRTDGERGGSEREGEFKAVEKGRFRESDVRNGGRKATVAHEEGRGGPEARGCKNQVMGKGATVMSVAISKDQIYIINRVPQYPHVGRCVCFTQLAKSTL